MITAVTSRKRPQKIVVIREYHNCKQNANQTATITSSKIELLEGGKFAISSLMDINRDVKAITKAIIKVEKCPSFAEKDKCEFLTEVPLNNVICERLKHKNAFWSEMVQNVEPPFQCPFKKGIYNMKRTVINPGPFISMLPNVVGHYYMFYVNGFEGDAWLGCLKFGGEITTVRA
ncbi:hypothetical protein AAG570_013551 [Ranatra chinensis]|uniref:MD-2-related lipid-recognition domain-containing protein n=1 Tax=Ranatra chinensis TaxID=642074 RepID=A0ABD0YEF0_9HEMI